MHDMFEPMARFLERVPSLLPAAPRAILVVTAHWEAEVVSFTGGPRPQLIYDYYGFPKETYELRYDAPAEPALARRAANLLRDASIDARVDDAHGWDHGVFIPLMVMYPTASIPVVAMSLHRSLDPAFHVSVGAALRPLRDDGVLIVGSGMSYHNLRDLGGVAAAAAFDGWLDAALAGDARHRGEQLARWAEAPAGRAAHPREEHLLPLMVASGAGGDRPGDKVWEGAVVKTRVSAWAFG